MATDYSTWKFIDGAWRDPLSGLTSTDIARRTAGLDNTSSITQTSTSGLTPPTPATQVTPVVPTSNASVQSDDTKRKAALDKWNNTLSQIHNEGTRATYKPTQDIIMDVTGLSYKDATTLLYGNVANNQDLRDWNKILNSENPLQALQSATQAMLFGELNPEQASYVTDKNRFGNSAWQAPTLEDVDVVARAGNLVAYKDSQGGLTYRLVGNQGQMIGNPIGGGDAAGLSNLLNTYGINYNQLNQLADEMDKSGVGYKPNQLYAGTGSNLGIDLRNLASGGMGTAYDWTKDSNAFLKDEFLQGAPAAYTAQDRLDYANKVWNERNTSGYSGDSSYLKPLSGFNPNEQYSFVTNQSMGSSFNPQPSQRNVNNNTQWQPSLNNNFQQPQQTQQPQFGYTGGTQQGYTYQPVYSNPLMRPITANSNIAPQQAPSNMGYQNRTTLWGDV